VFYKTVTCTRRSQIMVLQTVYKNAFPAIVHVVWNVSRVYTMLHQSTLLFILHLRN